MNILHEIQCLHVFLQQPGNYATIMIHLFVTSYVLVVYTCVISIQFDVLIDDQKPTENELNRFLTKYCTLWRPIGLKLGLQTCVMDMVKSSHPTEPRECLRETLQKWLLLDGDIATWQTLELAITNVN